MASESGAKVICNECLKYVSYDPNMAVYCSIRNLGMDKKIFEWVEMNEKYMKNIFVGRVLVRHDSEEKVKAIMVITTAGDTRSPQVVRICYPCLKHITCKVFMCSTDDVEENVD